MDQVWERGEASVREVMEALNAGADKARAYTTYMTIMARLNKKGLLRRRRVVVGLSLAPAFERDEYIGLRARAEAQRLVSEYGDAALSQFAQQLASLDPARRRALQRLVRKS